LLLSSQKYGFGIRDPGSEIRDPEKNYSGFQIPDPGVKKAPDPGSGSATLNRPHPDAIFFYVNIEKNIFISSNSQQK
jgi:hypothetical protein